LDIIQLDMLLLESGDRKSSEEIRNTLDIMYQKCRTNEEYAMKKTPSWMSTIIPKVNIAHFVKEDVQHDAAYSIYGLSHLEPCPSQPVSRIRQLPFVWKNPLS